MRILLVNTNGTTTAHVADSNDKSLESTRLALCGAILTNPTVGYAAEKMFASDPNRCAKCQREYRKAMQRNRRELIRLLEG